jgi:hypothetical protein
VVARGRPTELSHKIFLPVPCEVFILEKFSNSLVARASRAIARSLSFSLVSPLDVFSVTNLTNSSMNYQDPLSQASLGDNLLAHLYS